MKYVIDREKLKKSIKKYFGVDLTNKMYMVTSRWDLPIEFRTQLDSSEINHYLNRYGPMYVIELNDKKYLFQPNDKVFEVWVVTKKGEYYEISELELMRQLGISPLSLTIDDLINTYIEE